MNAFQALVLGLIQGLTEFLPISSSAHLRIASAFFGWSDPGAAFTAVTQLGTESAVLLYFRADIKEIVVAWGRSLTNTAARHDPNAHLGWFVILGTLPVGIFGLALQDTIESTFRDLRLIGMTLIVFGLILGAADRVAKNRRPLGDLTLGHALLYGFAQSLALMPGVSRSGGTITAGLLLGYRREAAARYSFLLAIPAVLASGLLELTKIGEGPAPPWGPSILATGVAFVVGYLVIAWFLRYLSTHTFGLFVAYRVILGAVVIILVADSVLAPTSGGNY